MCRGHHKPVRMQVRGDRISSGVGVAPHTPLLVDGNQVEQVAVPLTPTLSREERGSGCHFASFFVLSILLALGALGLTAAEPVNGSPYFAIKAYEIRGDSALTTNAPMSLLAKY